MLGILAAITILALIVASAMNFASYGRTVTDTIGKAIQATADGRPEWKHGGVTIDWSKITAVSSDTTLADGTVVKNGDKYIRYGTVLDIIGTAEVQTVDLSPGADPTGGTFTLSHGGSTTVPIAYNATAAVVQAALAALPSIGVDGVVVTGPASFVYTLTFHARLGNVAAVTADGSAMTTAQAITITTTQAGVGTGLYAPVDTSASDGRQTMARGETFILNETVVKSESGSDNPAVLEGGLVYEGRLVVNGTNEPTIANLLTAMPRLRLVKELA